VHVLLGAVQRLNRRGTPVALDVHGDETRFPSYVAALRRAAGGTPLIRFRGPYENAGVGRVLEAVDVLAVPSLWYEVHPLVVLEAFAARVPVVASDHPNLAFQVQHEVNGLRFRPGDADDLARQLGRLRDEPGLLGRLSRGTGPVRSVEGEMEEVLDAYRTAAASAGAPPVPEPVAAGDQR
jgi:glycosyltransferase involved in cell wall biosynthesis